MKKSHYVSGLVAGVCLLAGAVTTSALAFDLVPYQATGWSYLQVGHGDPVESVFMEPAFDDASWAVGQAAFGWVGYNCPLEFTVHTLWAFDTDMLLRRWFYADPGSPLVIHFGIDNDAKVWVNGVLVADAVHEGCAALDGWNILVPAGVLAYGGNLVAVEAVDRGATAFIDLRIEGEMPVPTAPTTWGKIKSHYR